MIERFLESGLNSWKISALSVLYTFVAVLFYYILFQNIILVHLCMKFLSISNSLNVNPFIANLVLDSVVISKLDFSYTNLYANNNKGCEIIW